LFSKVVAFWELDEGCFDPEQIHLLVYLLPIAHRVAGQLDWTKQSLQLLLGQEVTLGFSDDCKKLGPMKLTHDTAHPNPEPQDLIGRVGGILLGVDSVLGTPFWDGTRQLRLTVHLFSKNDLPGFLPGQRKWRQLERLCAWFLPVEPDWDIRVETPPQERSFVLDNDPKEARLGYSLGL
jgi:hypothetical protein